MSFLIITIVQGNLKKIQKQALVIPLDILNKGVLGPFVNMEFDPMWKCYLFLSVGQFWGCREDQTVFYKFSRLMKGIWVSQGPETQRHCVLLKVI